MKPESCLSEAVPLLFTIKGIFNNKFVALEIAIA